MNKIEVYTVVSISGGLERYLVYAGVDKKEARRVAGIEASEGLDVELMTWVDGVQIAEEFIQPD
ncbi:hypothetical protein BSP38_021 [Bacillus phage BSP38]|uniref:Uncharacterized protein n=1 Tax=Bacillus phage BSP38 TaxID=2283013 RepID=A0A345MJN1_BPBSP|nr:hypothetical protein HWB82_gp021 [Bacillus phage BSP38]AXH71063.1 hypothetical protein BSP38_021 [Bacillus phage BSP38]